MKKLLVNSFCLLAALCYSNIAIAKTNSCNIEDTCTPCCNETPKIGEPCNCAYNAPARIDTSCGWDTWISGSFIYWQSKEKGLKPGYEYNYIAASNTKDSSPLFINFNYHPGLKIGLGVTSEKDDWTIFFEYTHLKSSDSYTKDITETVGEDHYFIKNNWIRSAAPDGLSSYLKAKWFLDYNICDVELARPYYLGKNLIFNPHFGMRGGWINQKYNIDTITYKDEEVGFIDIFARNYQDSWLLGPRAGVKTNWLLNCHFRLFGNFASSLIYQNFISYIKETIPLQDNITQTEHYTGKMDSSYLTPNIEFALGIGFGTYSHNNKQYFDISLGYDFHYFWNQNFMKQLADEQQNYSDGDAGNLMLHGLTITARVDF